MSKPMLRLTLAALLLAAAPLPARAPAVQAAPQPAPVPPGQVWLDHFRDDLLPFWNLPDAWGSPRGDFPTFRCNDGHLPDPKAPCPELGGAPRWIRESFGREFVRMKSRQTYFYGVAYHLTGDPKMLELARDGVQFIRTRALDPVTGSAISYWDKDVAGPAVLERTSQDLAYAQLGLAMYWYLTRDPAVLADLTRLKNHIFTQYWNADWDMLMWTAKDDQDGGHLRQELVSQLDQVNAYLLLVTPTLPRPQRQAWEKDLLKLAHVMIDKYFSPAEHRFWGTIQDPKGKAFGARHNDFGHTAKALWMIERIGRLTGDQALVAFATREAGEVLKAAYLPDSGSWASKPLGKGEVETSKEWWIYAELDQTAATLALQDPAYARYLPKTYGYWLKYMVDHEHHEIYGGVNGDTNQPYGGPKIHQWKSGYHSAEHALVSYLTSQALNGQPVTLYYAPAGANTELRPYFFSGQVDKREASALPGFGKRKKLKVTFSKLR